VPSSATEAAVLDASAMVETLLGTQLGDVTRGRIRGRPLHAPAHLDADVLSALGRMYRAGELDATTVTTALEQLATAPIRRHPLAGLLIGAWRRRENQRLADALYVELADSLDAARLLTTDARLARSYGRAQLVALDD
jgi:predicted nucleic acid-binding protein